MKRSLITIMVITSLCACHNKGKGLLLRLRYDKGETMDVKYRVYAVTENENDQPIYNEYTRLSLWVDSVTRDSGYILGARIDYVRAQNGGFMAGKSFNYDESEAESNMTIAERKVHDKLKPAFAQTQQLVINNTGEVLKPFSLNGAATPQGASVPIEYGLYQISFPKDSVWTGDTWTSEKPLRFYNGATKFTYHIQSIYRSIIQIKAEGTLEDERGRKSNFSGMYLLDEATKKLISVKLEAMVNDRLNGRLKLVVDIESR